MVLWQLTTMAKKYIPVPRKPLAHTDDAASRLLESLEPLSIACSATGRSSLQRPSLEPNVAGGPGPTSRRQEIVSAQEQLHEPPRDYKSTRRSRQDHHNHKHRLESGRKGKRVLIIDTDPQASVTEVLGLKPDQFLFNFLIDQRALDSCVTRTRHERVEVLCSNRDTNKAEDLVSTQTAREHAFMHTLRGPDREYDWILIDCAPSIGLFQACAMVYARKVLVPVAMETLSVQGAISAVNAAQTLSRLRRSSHPSKSWA